MRVGEPKRSLPKAGQPTTKFNSTTTIFSLNNPVGAGSSPRHWFRQESPSSAGDVIIDDEPPGPPPTLGNMREENSKWVLSSEGKGVPQKTDGPIYQRGRCVSERLWIAPLRRKLLVSYSILVRSCCQILEWPGGNRPLIKK